MSNKSVFSCLACLTTAVLLTACGNGGDSTGGTNSGGSLSTSTTVSSSGVITGFGSVFVNGIRYEVDNGTVVAIEDEPETTGSDDPLRLGMKVRLRARERSDGSRVADRIEYDEDLKGRAINVIPDGDDPTVGTFEVMGTTVTVDVNTVFDDDVGDNDANPGIDIRDLDLGGPVMLVEVSGYPTPSGFLATRVDRLNPPGVTVDDNEAEVKGTITDTAGLPNSFELNNNLTVNIIGGTTFDDGLDNTGDLTEGLFVEVKGTRVNDTEIDADEIELEDRLDDEDREGEFEMEGVLQSLNLGASPNVVVINGLTLQVQDAGTLDGLVGRRIELEGRFNSNDVLVLDADGVELELEENVRTRDLLREVDTTRDRLITRLGLQIQATGRSRVQDRTRDRDNLTVDDFITGLQGKGTSSGGGPVLVEARGGIEGGGVTWTLIDVDDADDDEECRLRGPITEKNVANSTFRIRGVTVNTTTVSASGYLNASEVSITKQQFFDALVNGQTIVQATSKETPGPDCANLSLSAEEVEIED